MVLSPLPGLYTTSCNLSHGSRRGLGSYAAPWLGCPRSNLEKAEKGISPISATIIGLVSFSSFRLSPFPRGSAGCAACASCTGIAGTPDRGTGHGAASCNLSHGSRRGLGSYAAPWLGCPRSNLEKAEKGISPISATIIGLVSFSSFRLSPFPRGSAGCAACASCTGIAGTPDRGTGQFRGSRTASPGSGN